MAHYVLKITGHTATIVSEHETYGDAIDAWYKLDDERIATGIKQSKCYYAVRDTEDDQSGLVAMAMFGGEEDDDGT
jgi:hypothetical protein